MTTEQSQAQSQSPALVAINHSSYPVRFYGRVPKTIKMLETVKPDRIPGLGYLPGSNGMVALAGQDYPAWTNKYGAVSAIMADGRMLGVKPDEFEVIEFFPIKEDV